MTADPAVPRGVRARLAEALDVAEGLASEALKHPDPAWGYQIAAIESGWLRRFAARWDPAAVLRLVERERRLIERHRRAAEAPDDEFDAGYLLALSEAVALAVDFWLGTQEPMC